jgi:hypothetical protein
MHRDRERTRRRWRQRTPRGNFLWVQSWRLAPAYSSVGPIASHGVLIHPDQEGDYFQVGVLPDKRSPGPGELNLALQVSGDVAPHVLGNHLLKIEQMLMQSAELWATLTGTPLDAPRTFVLMRADQAITSPPGTSEAPPEAVPPETLRNLQCLRDLLASRLTERRADPTWLLRGHTVEQLCEVLVMLVCGQEMVLLVGRDPWRWDHTAEELRAAEEAFGPELRALRTLTQALGQAMGAEPAAERLLAVFVEGGWARA